MTFTLINVVFLGAAVTAVVAVAVLHRPAGGMPPLRALGLGFLVMAVLTMVFDNVMIAARLFELCDLGAEGEAPSYAELAERFGVSVSDVTNGLSLARREFRRVVLELLRELTGSEDELRLEARALLGIDAP